MPAHPYPEPDERYTLVQLEDGQYLTYDGGELGEAPHAGDAAMWETTPGGLRHHTGGIELAGGAAAGGGDDPLADPIWELELPDAEKTTVALQEGPGALPSEFLASIAEQGYVVCSNLLGDRLLGRVRAAIARVRADPTAQAPPGTDQFPPGDTPPGAEPRAMVVETDDRTTIVNCIADSPDFARMALHPVLLHMVTEYVGTPAVRLAHSPAVGIMKPRNISVDDAGELPGGGGWHVGTLSSLVALPRGLARATPALADLPGWAVLADYPLHDITTPPYPPGVVLGLQCNVCIGTPPQSLSLLCPSTSL